MIKIGVSPKANAVIVVIAGCILGGSMMAGVSSLISENREWFFPEDVPSVAEDLLLTIEDMREPEYESTVFEAEQKESLFIKWTKGTQRAAENAGENSWLEYQIYDVKISGLYEYFLELVIDESAPIVGSGWRTINVRNPEAGSVYQCGYGIGAGVSEYKIKQYIIRTENRIIRLKLGWNATEEELNMAMRALGIIK